MMNSIKMIVSLLISFSLIFSVQGQDVEERNLESFHEIRTGQAIDVYLKKGSTESVKIEAKGIDLNDVVTFVSGGRLKIELNDGHFRNHSVKVYVTYVNLDGISASSASSVYGEDQIEGESMDIGVSSAADVEVSVAVNQLEVSVSSSGDLDLKGSANYAEIKASSAGGIDAYDLKAKHVRARVSSAGSAKIHALQEIDADASSGGSIRYRGNPQKSQTNTSSGGSVRKSD
ncbi:head GIN domain-containing protein [Fulvivirga sediminis]|uniref:DUF2807 domain-containing protein n=1 Tax=Fulvivirga sediminis TaxID=2803949 RepID=A0A937F7T1_9BACT|nr:head GIN domain-containing protein [Fulvivirga sediminis]MBL3658022.1 DUF2807 domain-containing protein [Fulvivirga sediminis]